MMISGQQDGMQTMEMDLARLVSSGILSFDTAAEVSQYPKEILAQAATFRSQQQAQATLEAAVPPPPAPAPTSPARFWTVRTTWPLRNCRLLQDARWHRALPGRCCRSARRLAGVTMVAEDPK